MRPRTRGRSVALLSCLLLGACASGRGPGCAPPAYAPPLARARAGPLEDRYAALRALAGHDRPVVRRALRSLLEDEEPMVRNAAARSLADLGEWEAAATLIANLDREQRTFVVTDAIHHLRALFGTDRGYEPNLGYRHQTERQAAWWTWWAAQPFGAPRPPAPADDATATALREEIAAAVATLAAAEEPDDTTAADAEVMALWTRLAEIAPSRDPRDVAVVADGFAALVARRPKAVDLWNNHALACLNDGRFQEAERSYRRALALTPDDAQLHNDQGILLEGRGHRSEARRAYETAARLAPLDDVGWANLGDVCRALGNVTAAVRAWRKAEQLAPDKWMYHRLWIGRVRARQSSVLPATCASRRN